MIEFVISNHQTTHNFWLDQPRASCICSINIGLHFGIHIEKWATKYNIQFTKWDSVDSENIRELHHWYEGIFGDCDGLPKAASLNSHKYNCINSVLTILNVYSMRAEYMRAPSGDWSRDDVRGSIVALLGRIVCTSCVRLTDGFIAWLRSCEAIFSWVTESPDCCGKEKDRYWVIWMR